MNVNVAAFLGRFRSASAASLSILASAAGLVALNCNVAHAGYWEITYSCDISSEGAGDQIGDPTGPGGLLEGPTPFSGGAVNRQNLLGAYLNYGGSASIWGITTMDVHATLTWIGEDWDFDGIPDELPPSSVHVIERGEASVSITDDVNCTDTTGYSITSPFDNEYNYDWGYGGMKTGSIERDIDNSLGATIISLPVRSLTASGNATRTSKTHVVNYYTVLSVPRHFTYSVEAY